MRGKTATRAGSLQKAFATIGQSPRSAGHGRRIPRPGVVRTPRSTAHLENNHSGRSTKSERDTPRRQNKRKQLDPFQAILHDPRLPRASIRASPYPDARRIPVSLGESYPWFEIALIKGGIPLSQSNPQKRKNHLPGINRPEEITSPGRAPQRRARASRSGCCPTSENSSPNRRALGCWPDPGPDRGRLEPLRHNRCTVCPRHPSRP